MSELNTSWVNEWWQKTAYSQYPSRRFYFSEPVAKRELKGEKNNPSNKEFVELCKLTKEEMKSYLAKELSKYYRNVISKDGFLYVKGKDKIALTAHMDTTPTVEYGTRKPVKDVYEYIEDENHVIHSPEGIGGDDRCGIYIIMKILKETDYRPSIIFCEDEEIGCVGSDKFATSKFIKDLENVNFIVELDRRGNNDMVFYEDENEKFHEYVGDLTGYIEKTGSCSDISNICPACGIAGVNLSVGYHNEHHEYETVVLEEMENTYEATLNLLLASKIEDIQFEYIEYVYRRDWGNKYDSYRIYNSVTDTYDEYQNIGLYVEWDNGYGDKGDDEYQGDSFAEVWEQFFTEHPNIGMTNVVNFLEYDLDDDANKVI